MPADAGTNATEAEYGEAWAEIYDELFAATVPEPQLKYLTELSSSGRALELGIGTGRVALPLAARGVTVEGLDISPAMVARLRAKSGGDAIAVTIGSMAEVPVEGSFQLVFVVFNTIFGLASQADQVRCFQRVGELLQPGGVFVLECFVPDVARFDRGQAMRAVRVSGDEVLLEASRHDSVAQVVSSQHIWIRDGSIRMRPVTIRYAWPAELDLMARLAGLRLRDRWAGWGQEPFTDGSTMHVSVYERPAT